MSELWSVLLDVASQPLLSPDCTRLQPVLCEVIPDVDSQGAPVYTSYSVSPLQTLFA